MPRDGPRPLLIDRMAPGCDSYMASSAFPVLGITRRWKFHGNVRSVQLQGGGIVKSRDKFTEHFDPDALTALLAEATARGVTRPSSYGDLYHQRNATVKHPGYSVKMFPATPGAWIEVLTPRSRPVVRDRLRLYDLRSAYLWALMQGLPDPATFHRVKRFAGPGVYWVESPNAPGLPYPWHHGGLYPASDDEIETLALHAGVTDAGVAFTPGTLDTRGLVADIRGWTCWKAVARSYWGRWGTAAQTVAETMDPATGAMRTTRALRDPFRAPLWAVLITSRVRMRLYRAAMMVPTLRVHTDSVLTPGELDTGEGVGDWVLRDEFPRGGLVTVNGVMAA